MTAGMRIVRPYAIQDGDVTSNATNVDTAWNSATAYTVGQKVSYGRNRYESIQNGTNKQPDINPDYWFDLGVNNIWAMFDDQTGTQTTRASPLNVEVETVGYINTIGLLNITGNSVEITATDGSAPRTNLCLYSDEIDNAAWSKTSGTVTPNDTTAPDGTATADIFIPAAASSTHSLRQDITVTSGATATFSAYFKQGGYTRVRVRIVTTDNVSAYQIDADISNGTITTAANAYGSAVAIAGSIEADENGFYRLQVTGNIPSTTTYRVMVYVLNSSGQATFIGDGTSGIYMWGAQMEEAPQATQLIHTTSAPVTVNGIVVYNETITLIDDSVVTDYYEYFFEPLVPMTDLVRSIPGNVYSPTISISLSGPSTVGVGTMVMGQSRFIGMVYYGATIGIIDFSLVEDDDFGNTTIVERNFVRRGRFTVSIDAANVDATYNLVSSYRATPVMIIATEKYASTFYYGLLREAEIEIAYPKHSVMSLEVRGL